MTGSSRPSAELAGQLRGVIGQLRRRLRQVDNAGVLTPSQAAVLSRLDRDGPATQSELAAAENVRQQSMAATLNALTELGYLDRVPDAKDGRRTVISLSEPGAKTIRGIQWHRDEWLARELTAEFSAGERAAIAAAVPLLRRLAQVSGERE